MVDDGNALFRRLPGLGELLESAQLGALLEVYSRERVTAAVRVVLGELRAGVGSGALDEAGLAAAVGEIGARVAGKLAREARPRLRRVVNATGVILQTNLGRAPLSEAAIARVAEVARGYCNLEFDLERGEALLVHAEALERLKDDLQRHRGETFDVARFKSFTGLTRKHAIPLLEYLDGMRVTRNVGGVRVVN